MFDKLPFLKHDAQLPATTMKVQFDHIVLSTIQYFYF